MIRNASKYLLLSLILAFSAQFCSGQAAGKKILIEKITSAGCPGCPWGSYLIDSFIQLDTNIIPVTIHRSDSWHPDLMATEDGDSILSEYLWAHPTLMVDRYKWPQYQHVSNTVNHWSTMINDREQTPLVVSIGGSTTYNTSTRELEVTVSGNSLWELPYEVRTNVYIVESPVTGVGLGYDQLNGYNNQVGHPLYQAGDPIVGYAHKWVLRDMLGGHHGRQSLQQPLPAAQPFSETFSTTLDTAWDANNVYVIAIIQKHNADPQMREILNCAKIPLNSSIAMGNEVAEAAKTLNIWPQPSSGVLNIAFPANESWEVELFDLQGKLIATSSVRGNNTQLEISAHPSGMYLLKAASDNGASYSQKVILR